MTQTVFLEDCYAKECDSTVVAAEGSKVELDKTVFCYEGGGQPADNGKIISNSEEFSVASVKKESGKIIHYLDKPGLKAGDTVHCMLDWERRHKLMRHHTATHVLAAIMHQKAGALITGGQIDVDESRIDFNLETFDREKISEYVTAANETIRKNVLVKTYFLPREEAMKIPGVVKLANVLPPQVDRLRIVEIVGVDIQADGGTHVANTSEIGQIEVTKLDNKGKERRRVYFRLV